jgi:phage FluMu gp28-like protein
VSLIEARMKPAPVIRFTGSGRLQQCTALSGAQREMQDWIDEHLKPLLALFNPGAAPRPGPWTLRARATCRCIAPAQIAQNLRVRIPFLVELKNVPYNQQLQVLFAMPTHCRGCRGMVIDSRGNGSYIGEAALSTNTARWWCA